MEMIKSWVRDLVILVIFASMLEMLLPNGTLKKFVKLVIGFFMMLALLNPILSLLRADYTAFYPFNTLPNGKNQQAQIQQEGAKMQKANETLAVNAFQTQLEQQIRALILTQGEVDDAQVQVTAAENGTIQTVQVGLILVKAEGVDESKEASPGRVGSVQPIEINVQSSTQNTQREGRTTPSASNASGFAQQGEGSTSNRSGSAQQGAQKTPSSPRATGSVDQNQIQRVQDKVTKLIASFYNLKPDAISFQ